MSVVSIFGRNVEVQAPASLPPEMGEAGWLLHSLLEGGDLVGRDDAGRMVVVLAIEPAIRSADGLRRRCRRERGRRRYEPDDCSPMSACWFYEGGARSSGALPIRRSTSAAEADRPGGSDRARGGARLLVAARPGEPHVLGRAGAGPTQAVVCLKEGTTSFITTAGASPGISSGLTTACSTTSRARSGTGPGATLSAPMTRTPASCALQLAETPPCA